jgi:hypothetical protein
MIDKIKKELINKFVAAKISIAELVFIGWEK